MEIVKGNKTALLFGGTGLVGQQVLLALLEHGAYRKVISFGRRPLEIEHKRLTHHIMDFEKMNDVAHLWVGDDLFLCLGTTRAKAGSKKEFHRVDYIYPLQIARKSKVKQVLLVSSIGASPDALFHYLQVKGHLEHDLVKIPFWGVRIFRPSMLEGDRKEFRLGEEIGERFLRGVDFLSGGRAIPPRFKLVKDTTVARAMVMAAQVLEPGLRIYENEDLPRLAAQWKGRKPEKT